MQICTNIQIYSNIVYDMMAMISLIIAYASTEPSHIFMITVSCHMAPASHVTPQKDMSRNIPSLSALSKTNPKSKGPVRGVTTRCNVMICFLTYCWQTNWGHMMAYVYRMHLILTYSDHTGTHHLISLIITKLSWVPWRCSSVGVFKIYPKMINS